MPMTIFEDSQGAIALSNMQACWHYNFVRSALNDGRITTVYCSTGDTVADIFTKPATKLKLHNLCFIYLGSEKKVSKVRSKMCWTKFVQ